MNFYIKAYLTKKPRDAKPVASHKNGAFANGQSSNEVSTQNGFEANGHVIANGDSISEKKAK